MSTRSTRPCPESIVLVTDLLRPHGPRVTITDMRGRELGTLDRPLAEFLQEQLELRARSAA